MIEGLERRSDLELVPRLRRGERSAFALLMQQNNRRLYRLARSILRDSAEAEETIQESYVRAFTHLDSFTGEGSLAGWLARIVANEALGRLRRRRQALAWVESSNGKVELARSDRTNPTPEQDVARTEIRRMIEQAIDQIPVHFRTVFMLRALEEMSVEETAQALGIAKETVKTRFHRANRLLRAALSERLESVLDDIFPFAGSRCDRLQQRVLERVAKPSLAAP